MECLYGNFDPVNNTIEGNLKFKIKNFELRAYKVHAIEFINILHINIVIYMNI